MLRKKSNRPVLIKKWLELIWKIAATPSRAYSGVRKIVDNFHFSMTGEEMFSDPKDLDYSCLAYTNKGKFSQLARNYWNRPEVEKAVAKVNSRKHQAHTSVAIPLRAMGKESRSQGFCMQVLVLTLTKNKITIDIFYRSTEVIQKMLADWIFFNEMIPKELLAPCGIKPEQVDRVRFHFANAYLSGVFMPIVMRYEPDPVAFIESYGDEDQDPRFKRTTSMTMARYLRAINVYKYRTQCKMYEYLHEHVKGSKMQDLMDYLKPFRDAIKEDQVEEEEEDDE
jgi:hypothetical protein